MDTTVSVEQDEDDSIVDTGPTNTAEFLEQIAGIMNDTTLGEWR